MNKKLNNCQDRSICWNDLMANDWDYITKEILKDKCSKDCLQLSTCHRIVELLSQKKIEEALNLLNND